MQITQVILFLVAAIVGVVAGRVPPSHPTPPPSPADPENPCNDGLIPYCCSGMPGTDSAVCSTPSLTCTANICCPELQLVSKPSLKESVIKTYLRLIPNVLMTGSNLLRVHRPSFRPCYIRQLLLIG